ncbi:putative arabinosyltransferase ARAD1 [Bidens hawaiensis]|uniref:putative arabinosyltransferase ARAD1 n=1 Tax=Bidens hawaiensis TaxID=980011 RepID=UPI004048F784
MTEKRVFSSRLLSCLIAISMFFLILSCSLLFRIGDNSLVPTSIYNLIVADHGSVDLIDPKSTSCKDSCSCDPKQAVLKVFMYDLPPEFHFGLLGWTGGTGGSWPNVGNVSVIPRYPGGLNLQHSIEYWLTLDLLASVTLNVVRSCTAVLVHNSSQADIIFVPFFSSLSYNRHSKVEGVETKSTNDVLQERLVEYLNGRDEWKRFGGKDHLIMAHHPNSMLIARWKLGSAMFVLADFGRYDNQIANIDKDVIAPYRHVVRTLDVNNSPSFDERPTLVYFQGAIYRKDGGVIRQELFYLLRSEKDVHFAFGSAGGGGIHKASAGMAGPKFCLNIAGDTPSSNRLFDAIVSHCVPVIISDEIELPYEDLLDYSKFSIFVPASDACKKGYLMNLLRGVKKEKWTEMWENLKKVAPHFEYQYPSKPGDAVDMIWKMVSRKIKPLQYKAHRKNRFKMSQQFLNSR